MKRHFLKLFKNSRGEIASIALIVGMIVVTLGIVAGGQIIKQGTNSSSKASEIVAVSGINVQNTVLPGNVITNEGTPPSFATCGKGKWCKWTNGTGTGLVSGTGQLQLVGATMATGTGACWIQQLNVTQVSNKRYKIRADIDRPAALTGGQFFIATEIRGNANYNVKPITGSGIVSYAVDIPANVSSDFVSFKFCLWEAKFAQPTTVTLKNAAVYQVDLPTPTVVPPGTKPNITIQKTLVNPAPIAGQIPTVAPGAEVKYKIRVANTGGQKAINMSIIEDMTTGSPFMTFVRGESITYTGGASGSAVKEPDLKQPSVTNPTVVKWTGITMPINSAVEVVFTLKASTTCNYIHNNSANSNYNGESNPSVGYATGYNGSTMTGEEVKVVCQLPTNSPTPSAVPINVASNATGNIITNSAASPPTYPCNAVLGQWCISDNSSATGSVSSAGKPQLTAQTMAAGTYACWVQRLNVTTVAPRRYSISAAFTRPATLTGGQFFIATEIRGNANFNVQQLTGVSPVNYIVDIPTTSDFANVKFCLWEAKFAAPTTVTLNSLSVVPSQIPINPTNTPIRTPTPTIVPAITVADTTLAGNIITNNKAVAPAFPCNSILGQWCLFNNSNGSGSISANGQLNLTAQTMAASTGACWVQRLNVTTVAPRRYTIKAQVNRPVALTSGQFFIATEIRGNANFNVKPITGSGAITYTVDVPTSSDFANIKFCLWEAKYAQSSTVTLQKLGVAQSAIPATPTNSPTPTAAPSQNISIKANTALSKITGNQVDLVYDISTPQENTEAAWAFTFEDIVPTSITNVSWTCKVLKPGTAKGGMSSNATRCSSKVSGTGSNTVTFGHTSLADPLIHPGGAIQVMIKGVLSATSGTQIKNTAVIKSYSGWKAGHFFTNKRELYSTYPDANLNDNAASLQLTVPATACVPTLSAPANNVTLTTVPTFQWTACPGTNNKYQIIVTKAGAAFQNLIVNTNSYTFPSTQWTNATYSWTVKHCINPDCVGGTPSAARTFTYSVTSSCVAPVAPTGLQPNTDRVANPATGKMLIKWNPVAGADSYALRIDNKQNGWAEGCNPTNIGDVCINQSGSQYEYAVEPGQIYNVWVHAVKNCGGIVKYSVPVSQQFQIYIPTSPTILTPTAIVNTPTLTPTPTPTAKPPVNTLTPTPSVPPVSTNTPTTTPNTCPLRSKGDANCDDVINSVDYVCWKTKYIDDQTLENCKYTDFDNIGGTELLDFTIMKANFSTE